MACSAGCFNGAVDLHRRRVDCSIRGGPVPLELQWGRRSSSTESRSLARFRLSAARSLQWGRRSSSTESVTLTLKAIKKIYALQWGRRSSSRESLEKRYACEPADALQWGRRSSSTESSAIWGFAGSAFKLQWGRRSSSTERGRHNCPMTEFCIMLQWGRRSSSTERLSTANTAIGEAFRFNGAVDLHRRRGQRSQEYWRSQGSFNGAVDLHRRRVFADVRDGRVTEALQWGRRSSSTESAKLRNRLRFSREASMGPSIFIDGERSLPERRHPGTRLASMGPSIFIDGEPPVSLGTGPGLVGFNGAVDLHRRRGIAPRGMP